MRKVLCLAFAAVFAGCAGGGSSAAQYLTEGGNSLDEAAYRQAVIDGSADKLASITGTKGATVHYYVLTNGGIPVSYSLESDSDLLTIAEPTTESVGRTMPGAPQILDFAIELTGSGTATATLYKNLLDTDGEPTAEATVEIKIDA
ncbi:MAG: hypothetical protein LBR21_09310 [Propionibacteriaceae bacterium]|jgi:hypothetical protein|nr:hypothetical protein [Propionibacteriaceae bacterium]